MPEQSLGMSFLKNIIRCAPRYVEKLHSRDSQISCYYLKHSSTCGMVEAQTVGTINDQYKHFLCAQVNKNRLILTLFLHDVPDVLNEQWSNKRIACTHLSLRSTSTALVLWPSGLGISTTCINQNIKLFLFTRTNVVQLLSTGAPKWKFKATPLRNSVKFTP